MTGEKRENGGMNERCLGQLVYTEMMPFEGWPALMAAMERLRRSTADTRSAIEKMSAVWEEAGRRLRRPSRGMRRHVRREKARLSK